MFWVNRLTALKIGDSNLVYWKFHQHCLMSLHGSLSIQIIKFENWHLEKPKGVLGEDYYYQCGSLLNRFYFELLIFLRLFFCKCLIQIFQICLNIVYHFIGLLICIFFSVFYSLNNYSMIVFL